MNVEISQEKMIICMRVVLENMLPTSIRIKQLYMKKLLIVKTLLMVFLSKWLCSIMMALQVIFILLRIIFIPLKVVCMKKVFVLL